MKTWKRTVLRWCRGWTLSLVSLTGCGDGGDNNGDGGIKKVERAADIITGATPGVASVRLTDSHAGWGAYDCFSCHESMHAGNYALGDCLSCHGQNNAPARPADHPDMGCAGCHPSAHPPSADQRDIGCRACHGATTAPGASCAYTESYDVAVIGGGGGGLAAASLLARSGYSVALVEQHYKVGGCMVGFTRGDYRFEASLHAYDGWGMSYLSALGINSRLSPVAGETMYRLVFPDLTIDVPADKAAYQAALTAVFPEEAGPIEDLFAGFSASGRGYPGLTLREAVASHGITDERLVTVFTILASYLAATPDSIPADAFLGMWGSYHEMGYYYFEGGSQAITDALAAAFTENGGVLKTHTRAQKITVSGGAVTGIRTADGGCYEAGAVISNASAQATYKGLLGEAHLPASLSAALETRAPAPSNLGLIFLGVDRDYTDSFPGGTHEIFVASDYDSSAAGIDTVRCLPEATDFIITNYSVLDPEAAPPGKNAIVITVDHMDYDCSNAWRLGDTYASYEAYKATLAEVLIARAEAILPDLSAHIDILEVASPKTVEQFTLNPRGSWAGWSFDPDAEPIPFLESTEGPVAGLFMAGAWVGGAGQSVALATGIQAAATTQAYLKNR